MKHLHNSISSDTEAIEVTRSWVKSFVIELGLCPFAAKPFNENRIEYRVLHASSPAMIVGRISDYVTEFLIGDIETALLICPSGLDGFLDYLDVLDDVQHRLQQDGRTGIIQLASFHPDYQFSGSDAGDAANYSNRSPFPMFHVLREASLSVAIDGHPDAESIPERNIQLLRKLGVEHLEKTLRSIRGLV